LAEEQDSWDSVYISSLSSDHDANLAGKNVVEVSESRGIEPEDCMMDLLLEQDGKGSIVFFHMAGSDVEQVIRWEGSLIASDSLHDQAENPTLASTALSRTSSPGTCERRSCSPSRRLSGR
jgi:N-acyl-D-aspartate/D-glutamate deacylase